MIRVVVENIVLFLLPTAVYVFWLMLAGTALVFLVLIAFGSTSGGKPGQSYVPPHIGRDGRIEPGELK
jgi:hypothetical protein